MSQATQAAYVAAGQGPQNNNPGNNPGRSFKDLLAALFGCTPDQCDFPITKLPDNGGDWIDKFLPVKSQPDIVVCRLPLPGGATGEIHVQKKSVRADIKPPAPPDHRLRTAIAMATLAMASPSMRTNGVNITADTPEEQAFLFIAATLMGLKIKNATPQMQQMAGQINQAIDIGKIWQGFQNDIRSCPTPAPKPVPPAPQAQPQQSPVPPGAAPLVPPGAAAAHNNAAVKQSAQTTTGQLHPQLQAALRSTKPLNTFSDSDLELFWAMMSQEGREKILNDNNLGHIQPDGKAKPALPQSDLDPGLQQVLRDLAAGTPAIQSFDDSDLAQFWAMLSQKDKEGILNSNNLGHVGLDGKAKPAAAPVPVAQPAQPPAPPAPAQPKAPASLTAVFNRAISDELKSYLQISKVDENIYKAITAAVIKDQDARRDTMRVKYKDAFNLTNNQIETIIKAMDQEGITSKPTRPGEARQVNYDSSGQAKPQSPAV